MALDISPLEGLANSSSQPHLPSKFPGATQIIRVLVSSNT